MKTAPSTGGKGKRKNGEEAQAEGENERNKVRYVRTLEEGLVREMSYVPKESNGVKKAGQGGGKNEKGKEKKGKDY